VNIDQVGIDLIVEFERLENEAYPDPATGGEPWTIGIGHTSAAGDPQVYPGLYVTDDEAYEIFARDVGQYEDAVNKNCPGPTTQNQFNAMVSLCYNIGPGNFDGSSVARYHNEQNYPQAAESFLLWNKANGVVMAGLTRRREAEKLLYETPDTAVSEPLPEGGVSPEEGEHPPEVVQYDYLIADSSQPDGGWELVEDAVIWRRKRR
jgi:GH24 family phage-related lysozyme (muramidase)